MLTETRPLALFGGLLWGDNAVRFIFVDEAGTSEREPETIVVAIMVNADRQLIFAETAVNEALGAVPAEFKHGFVFHAKEVWGSEKYREKWMMPDRLALLRTMMQLPRRLGLVITMARVKRTCPIEKLPPNLTKAQMHHCIAFAGCLATADRYIRNYAEPGEIATVVAEDVPEMRRHLERAAVAYRDMPHNLAGQIIPTAKDRNRGYTQQSSDFRISRIRRGVHFVTKGNDSLLQIADACAFGFRRYFAGQDFGDDFVRAMLGFDPEREDYKGMMSYENYYWHPRTI